MSNEIVVYWAPSAFDETESWNFLYREPSLLLQDLNNIRGKDGRDMNIFACPASNDYFRNLYVVRSNIKEDFEFPGGYLRAYEKLEVNPGDSVITDNIGNKVIMTKSRDAAYKGYCNLAYNLRWIFFAEEPLTARFSAPSYPAFSPVDGAILASGDYDIGQWFRSYNLDYHFPLDAKKFSLDIDDPMFYIQFFTDKKIIFKRFVFTDRLRALAQEFVRSPNNYQRFLPLSQRYEMAKRSQALQIVAKEIKNNLVD